MVDVSAHKDLLEAFIEHYLPTHNPLVLVTWGVGTSDRKKRLARRILEECAPAVVSGRMGDISALAMDVMDRGSQCVRVCVMAGKLACLSTHSNRDAL